MGLPRDLILSTPNRKLTQTEETVLIEWILSLDIYGIPPIQALV